VAYKMTRSDIEFANFVVFANGLVPLAMMAWDGYHGNLGANPVEFVLHTTGMMALVFTTISLAVTPIRKVTGQQWIAQLRRRTGLFGFWYALAHLFVYFGFDRSFDVVGMVADTVKRPFILVGMATFLLMVPLAVTSTDAMLKKLGGKRWRALHRIAYPIGVGGVVHYYMLVKADTRIPLAFGAVVLLLLGYRFVTAYVAPYVQRRSRATET
jgi:methionine sulfoxide reductase heme-binding subunit